MGLDLFHVVPAERADNNQYDYLNVEDLKEDSAFLETHKHLITDMVYVDYDFQIRVFADNSTKDDFLKAYPHYKLTPILVGDISKLGEELKAIAAKNEKYDEVPLVMHPMDNILSKKHSRDMSYYSVNYRAENSYSKVMYYNQIGYQRKGMDMEFYDLFGNGKLYFKKDAVLQAFLHLKAADDNVMEYLQKTFKQNFIDNFIEGKSIFFGSW